MGSIILFTLLSLMWISAMILFNNTKMNFFKFITGSLGLFIIFVIFFMPNFEKVLNSLVTGTLNIAAGATGLFEVYKSHSIVSIDTRSGIVSMFINYECSGAIEMLVFTSLAVFFPFSGPVRRCISVAMGNIYIFAANIIRVLFIIFVTKAFGAPVFYITHTLAARILFFALMIILYYFVFTGTHLKYQNVGEAQ
jgi:exosortase family protein XrtG